MSKESYDFGGRIISLQKYLHEICETGNCNFSYTPDNVPTYDRNEPHLFGRFQWYYDLVSRGRCFYIHKNKHFFSGVTLPWSDEESSFLKNSLVVLRPEIFGFNDELVKFIKALAKVSGNNIIVKHVEDNIAKELLNYGFRHYTGNEGWSSIAREDDQTYPEVIVDFEQTLSIPPMVQRSKHKAAKISQELFVDCIDPLRLERAEVRNSYKQEILYVFYRWVENFHNRQPWSVNADFLKWHLNAFETLVSNHRLYLIFLRNCHDEPVGVFSLAKTSKFQLDMVFSFIINENGDYQRIAYRAVFERMLAKGYKFMNLGGSEMESLFNFKNSLAVSTEIKGHHIVYESK